MLIKINEWFVLLRWIVYCLVEFSGYMFVVIGLVGFLTTDAHTISHLEAETTLNIGLVLILVGRQLRGA